MSKFHPLPVAQVERETRDAIAVTFDVPDSAARAFRFEPGQHLTLRTRDRRRGRAPLVFDLLRRRGGPLRIAVKRTPGRRVLDVGERSAARGRRRST